MSYIQSKITEAITSQEHGVVKVSLESSIDGNDELTIVPKGIHLSMFYSVRLNLVHEGDGYLHLYKCHINSLVTKPGTQIILYDCKFLNKLEMYGTAGRIEGSDVYITDEKEIPGSIVCLTEPWVKIEAGSSVKFIKTNFKNTRGAKKLCEIYRSDTTFIESRNLQEFQDCFYGEGSGIRIARSSFYSKYKCLDFFTGSRIHVSSSHLKGNEDMCIAASGNSTVRVSDCSYHTAPDGFIPKKPGKESKGLFGAGAVVRLSGNSSGYFQNTNLLGGDRLHDWGIKCDDGSKAIFVSTRATHDIQGGAFPAIECNGVDSSVRVYGYRFITSQALQAIVCTDGGHVYASDAEIVNSTTTEAIFISTYGSVELENVRQIFGQTDGIVMSEYASLVSNGPTDLISSLAGDGIHAENNCTVSLEDVSRIDGITAGVSIDKGCSVTLLNCPSIVSKTGPAIFVGEDSKVLARIDESMRKISSFIPAALESSIDGLTKGIELGKNASGTIVNYELVESRGGSSIVLADGAKLQTRTITEIKGLVSGVLLGEDCRWHAKNVKTISAQTGYGVYGDKGSSLSLEDFGVLDAGKGGVWLVNDADYLHITNFKEINAVLEDGIRFEGHNIALKNISYIETQAENANGLVIAGAEGKVSDVAEIAAFWTGCIIKNMFGRGSQIDATRMAKCEGKNSPHGLDVIGSQVRVDRSNFIKDGLVANSTVEYSSVTFGGALIGDASSIKLSSCFINGHIHLTDCSYDFLDTIGDGEQKNFNSSGVTRNYTQNATYHELPGNSVHTNLMVLGDVTVIGPTSSMVIEGGTLAATVQMLQATMKAANVTIGGTFTCTQSTVTQENTSVGGKVTAVSSTFKGATSTYLGGVDAPDSSLELDKCSTTAITVTNSSLGMFSGSAASILAIASGIMCRSASTGSINLTAGSSLVGESGALGNITVADSALQLHGTAAVVNGLAKAAILCSSGSVVQGGTKNRYASFKEHVHDWFGKDYKLRIDENYQLNVFGSSETNVAGPIDTTSLSFVRAWAPDFCEDTTNENRPTDKPKDPDVTA